MARAAKTPKAMKSATRGRQPGRPAAPAAKVPAKATRPVAAVKRVPVVAAPAPKLSKDELRGQVDKLERANTALRVKSREASRTAKTAAARIAELEDQLAQLEKKVASQSAPAKPRPKPSTAARRRQSGHVDPGDAVPPGVAVEESAPLDDAAETARENLEAHLGEE
jgi:hypothetical protein